MVLFSRLAPFILFFACLSVGRSEKLVVGATPVPAGEVLEFIKPRLAQNGLELEIKIFTDYVQPNVQLNEHRLDANFFQHRPFLAEFNRQKKAALVPLVGILVAPIGAYSTKWKGLAALPEGATIAIPNDPTNSARALLLLCHAGLIQLKDPQNVLATARDITANPKKLRFRELEAAMLARILDQVDLAVVNTNYALAAKLDPLHDALLLEDRESPYVNVLVARPDNRDSPALAKLSAALTTPEVRAFIETKYRGAVIPAF
jgi:D-methionine transport system substrate-binding protein